MNGEKRDSTGNGERQTTGFTTYRLTIVSVLVATTLKAATEEEGARRYHQILGNREHGWSALLGVALTVAIMC